MAMGNTWKRLKINCQLRNCSGVIYLHSDCSMYLKMLILCRVTKIYFEKVSTGPPCSWLHEFSDRWQENQRQLQASPYTGLKRPFRAPGFSDNRYTKVGKVVSPKHRPHLPPGTSLVFNSVRGWFDTRAIVMTEGMKNRNDPNGNRNRNLPAVAKCNKLHHWVPRDFQNVFYNMWK